MRKMQISQKQDLVAFVIKFLFRVQQFYIKGSERRASLYQQNDKKDAKPLKKGRKTRHSEKEL